MPRYMIFMPNGTQAVEDNFPLRHTITDHTLWAVGSDLLTCADVAQRLFMGVDGNYGVVVKIDEYYGAYDRALWDKLQAWGG